VAPRAESFPHTESTRLPAVPRDGYVCDRHRRGNGQMTTCSQFTPAAIMPEPLADGSPMASSPERRLLLAILEDAIVCFQKNYPRSPADGNRAFREAEEWIMSERYDGPFSFEHICSVLGLDPSAVRCRLRLKHFRFGGTLGRHRRLFTSVTTATPLRQRIGR
jgi:hypothetical protein